jgi:hypothetical protein
MRQLNLGSNLRIAIYTMDKLRWLSGWTLVSVRVKWRRNNSFEKLVLGVKRAHFIR